MQYQPNRTWRRIVHAISKLHDKLTFTKNGKHALTDVSGPLVLCEVNFELSEFRRRKSPSAAEVYFFLNIVLSWLAYSRMILPE